MSQVAITVGDYIDQNKASLGGGRESGCALVWMNKARYVAYGTGDWVGTLGHTNIPTHCGSFILPSEHESIREIRACSYGDPSVEYKISRYDYGRCDGPVITARLHGRVYCPVQLTEKGLCFCALNKKDDGVIMDFKYIDTNGSLRVESLCIPHEMKGYVELSYIPSKILKISKPVTTGRIEVRTIDGYVGFIEPYETIPQYSIYTSTGSHCSGPLFVKTKKRCIPYTAHDLDSILDIHPEALTSFILAARAKEDQKPTWVQDYRSLLTFAIEFLKKELINEDDTDRGMSPVALNDNFFDSMIADTSVVYGNQFP